jgi:hypothetical protein
MRPLASLTRRGQDSAVLLGMLIAAVLVATTLAVPALAEASAVIPTSSEPGSSPNVINNYVSVPFAANDDDSWPGSEGQNGPEVFPFGFSINFYGTKYGGAYINNNGNVTFNAPLGEFTPEALTTFGSPIIAPFFADVDTRGQSAIVNFGSGTLNGKKVFVANWPGVGCYAEIDSVLNNFQLILIDRPDRNTGVSGDDFDMEFNYNTIQWDTGEASGGGPTCLTENESGVPAISGYTNGTETEGDVFELPGSGVPDAFLDSSPSTGLINHDLNSDTPGRYLFTVVDGQPSSSGSAEVPASHTSVSSPSAPLAPPPPVLPPPPPKQGVLPFKLASPVLGKTVNIKPVSGVVFVKLPTGAHLSAASAFESLSKGSGFIPLTEARQIPVGSTLDTTRGVVQLTTATASSSQFQEGDFGAGIFTILQQRQQRGLVNLNIVNAFSPRQVCTTLGKHASVASKHLSGKVLGRLNGSAHGKYTTRGQYSAATVRGTIWSVTNRCAGTLTQVKRGVVAVRDFVRRKTITVRAGQQYLAKAP